MSCPETRRDRGPRRPDHVKRRLLVAPKKKLIDQLEIFGSYQWAEKHKMHPIAFGLSISPGRKRGDATPCDEHAGFTADKVLPFRD